MSRVALSDTGDWQLKHSDHDIRGHDVLDHSGTRVGIVDEMIVNTNEKRVDTVVLEDGREIPARDISISDGTVYLSANAATASEGHVAVYDSGEVVARKEVTTGNADAYSDDFRTHYKDNYADSGRDYSHYESAYRYGHDQAYQDTYRNRSYRDAEADLRRGYTSSHPGSSYDDVGDAVRYGFNSARRGRR